jgi:hypothetical protein
VPRHFGGYEMTIREKLEVSATVAEACGSTGWVVALTNVCNWMASVLPDVDADPRRSPAYAITRIIPDEDNITPLKLASLAEAAQPASRQLW